MIDLFSYYIYFAYYTLILNIMQIYHILDHILDNINILRAGFPAEN